MGLVSCILILTIPTSLSISPLLALSYLGSNDVDLTEGMWKDAHKKALLEGIRSGDIWLNKIKYDNNDQRIYSNVCLEVYSFTRHMPVTACQSAACTVGNIQEGFTTAMSELCDLHARTGVGESGEYLTPNNDKQVGLGVPVLPTPSDVTK